MTNQLMSHIQLRQSKPNIFRRHPPPHHQNASKITSKTASSRAEQQIDQLNHCEIHYSNQPTKNKKIDALQNHAYIPHITPNITHIKATNQINSTTVRRLQTYRHPQSHNNNAFKLKSKRRYHGPRGSRMGYLKAQHRPPPPPIPPK